MLRRDAPNLTPAEFVCVAGDRSRGSCSPHLLLPALGALGVMSSEIYRFLWVNINDSTASVAVVSYWSRFGSILAECSTSLC